MNRRGRTSTGGCQKGHRPALTLIELLVTISVIGLLLSVLLCAVQQVRARAAQAQCANSLHQIAIALHGYESAHQSFPPRPTTSPNTPEHLLSWRALLLPFVEQDNLWQQSVAACALTDVTYNSEVHLGYVSPMKVFACPADDRLGATLITPSNDRAAFSSYLGVAGSFQGKFIPGVFDPARSVTALSITDGLSNTLAVGERPPPASLQTGRWYSSRWIIEPFGGYDSTMSIPALVASPDDLECRTASRAYGPGRLTNPCDRLHFWSLHPGGANFAFADGSVRFLSYSAASVLPALATRAGGEVVGGDY